MRGALNKYFYTKKILNFKLKSIQGLGGYPLAYFAGANYPEMIIKEYILNEKLSKYFENWSDKMLMLRYDKEIIVQC